jgi:hypothetical protein
MLIAMILGHLLFLAAATTYFTFQNFVPVLPFTSIAAAWAMASAAEGLTRRLPTRGRPVARGVIWAPVAALLAGVLLVRTHQAAVPPTSELVARHLRGLDARRARVVYNEASAEGEGIPQSRQGPEIVWVERVDTLPPEVLEGVDAVVFPARRLDGRERESHGRLLASWPGSVRRFEPRWFHSRGPALVLASNDWQVRGEPLRRRLELRDGVVRMPLAEPLRPGDVASVALQVQTSSAPLFPDSLRVPGAGELRLHELPGGPHRSWIVTSKVRLRRATAELVFELPELAGRTEPVTVELYRWRRSSTSSSVDQSSR